MSLDQMRDANKARNVHDKDVQNSITKPHKPHFFPSLTQQGKKGGNFKTSMHSQKRISSYEFLALGITSV